MANLAVTGTAGAGWLTMFAAGGPRPATSTLNWSQSGVTVANAALGPLGATRQLAVYAVNRTQRDHRRQRLFHQQLTAR